MNRLSIQFVRNTETKTSDDQAVIDYISVDNYNISYTDAVSGTQMKFATDSNGVFRWTRRTLRLLEEDSDPFKFIQLNVYAMPATLFPVAELNKHYETILDAVEFYLDVISSAVSSPPMTPPRTSFTQKCPGAPARRHLFFDEDGIEYTRPPIREIDFNY